MSEQSAIISSTNLLINGGEFNLFQEQTRESRVEFDIRKLHDHISLDAFHNSKERCKEVNPQTVRDIAQEWLSRLQRIPTTSDSSSSSRPLLNMAPIISRITTTHTSEDVLKDIFNWLYDRDSRFLVMWVHDQRRDQTSLVAQVVAEVLHERRELSASYFSPNPDSQASNTKQNNGSFVIPTLAYQLSENLPELRSSIARNVHKLSIFTKLKSETQLKELVVEPLVKASEGLSSGSPDVTRRFIVIHCLEDLEDDDDDFQNSFLHAISQALRRLKSGNYSQKLLLLGRHTNRLRDCLLGSTMQSFVLQRPIVLDQVSTKVDDLKRWEEELQRVAKALFEQQQQWEERVKGEEKRLMDSRKEAEDAVVRGEDEVKKKNEDLKRLEGELQKKSEAERIRKEELGQAAKTLIEQQRAKQQGDEQLRVQEKRLLDSQRAVDEAVTRREEERKVIAEQMNELRTRQDMRREKDEELVRARTVLHDQQQETQKYEDSLREKDQSWFKVASSVRVSLARHDEKMRKEEVTRLEAELRHYDEAEQQWKANGAPEESKRREEEAERRVEEAEGNLKEVEHNVEESKRKMAATEHGIEMSTRRVEASLLSLVEEAILMVQGSGKEQEAIDSLLLELKCKGISQK